MDSGFINVLKPPGLTSQQVVGRVRKLMNTRAVGHGGTLDPAASGILPVAVGRATRLLEYVLAADKTYLAEATFGVATDTLDQEGQIVWRAVEPPLLSAADLTAILPRFLGPGLQTPPAYSAIKQAGRPLYSYARAGHAVRAEPRQIHIYELSLLHFSSEFYPRALFTIKCSKGTYVRTLLADIAKELNTNAVLTFLLRTTAGPFSLEQSFTLEELSALSEKASGVSDTDHPFLLSPSVALSDWPRLELDMITAGRFVRGQRLSRFQELMDRVAVFHGELLLGVGEVTEGVLRPSKVLLSWEELQANAHH